MKNRRRGNKFATIILALIFLAGLCLILYPAVSDYWNTLHQSRAIAEYAKKVAQMDAEDYERQWEAARDYNRRLLEKADRYEMTEEERAEYESLLNISVFPYLCLFTMEPAKACSRWRQVI